MMHLGIPGRALPDMEHLKKQGNVPALIRLLGHQDADIRQQAARALGESGSTAIPVLVVALHSSRADVRLGIVAVLGDLNDARTVRPLAAVLGGDPVTEVRWAAALALGGCGSADAVPPLVSGLRDRNRYVRFGAALALADLGWTPATDEENACRSIALQDWDHVRDMGAAATAPLVDMFRDSDPATRTALATLIGQMGLAHSPESFQPALTDRNPGVRWRAALAAMNSGIAPQYLPRILAKRERTGPDPAAAAILNFLFLGIGYNYLGRWWGFPVFMSYMTIIVLAQLATGPFLPYLVAYPLTAVIAAHTYYTARQEAERQ
jgi:HEAT repeat protein